MNIKESQYLGSYPSIEKCPPPDRPEVAFIGRSNVGKSSLINMLTGRKQLARTSHTPGKTQTLNFYEIKTESGQPAGGWYLVDMPGYGYAKRSKKARAQWERMSLDYFLKRPTLVCVCVLIDVRIPPQEIDRTFIDELGAMRIPFVLVFTKADKKNQREVSQNVKAFLDDMKKSWEFLPAHFITSAKKGAGKEKLLEYLQSVMEELPPVE